MERKCKSEIEAERLKDLELGFYYCLVQNRMMLSKTTYQLTEDLEVRELKWSAISKVKFFPPRYGDEEIIYFERINQKPTFQSKPLKIIKIDNND